MPARNIRVRPIRSASRPPSSRKLPNAIRYAFGTQVSDEAEKSRSVLIAGSATATIVASRIIMSWPRQTTARASQRLSLVRMIITIS